MSSTVLEARQILMEAAADLVAVALDGAQEAIHDFAELLGNRHELKGIAIKNLRLDYYRTECILDFPGQDWCTFITVIAIYHPLDVGGNNPLGYYSLLTDFEGNSYEQRFGGFLFDDFLRSVN